MTDSADVIGSVATTDSADIIGSVVIIGAVGTIDSFAATSLSKLLFTETEAMEFLQEEILSRAISKLPSCFCSGNNSGNNVAVLVLGIVNFYFFLLT